jgi:hypothetical protein
VNIAGAQTTPTTSPPSLSALASLKAVGTAPGNALGANGQTSQDVVLLEAFLSLLTSFGTRVEGDNADRIGGPVHKKDDGKESAPGAFPPALLQTGPVAQALPQNPSAIAGQDAPETRSSSTGLPFPDPGAAAIKIAALQQAPISPAISTSRGQASTTIGNASMAFAVRLTDANGQLVAERLGDAGAAIRSIDDAVSKPLPDTNRARLPVDPAAPAALLATAPAGGERVLPQAAARETAHTGPQTIVNTSAGAASSALAASASAAAPPTPDIPPPQDQAVEHAANTPEEARRPEHSSAASPTDRAPVGQEEVAHASLPAQTAPVMSGTGSDTGKNTGARSVTAADTRTITSAGAEILETRPTFALQPAREISLRLVQPESPSVDIRVVDRAGSVRVAVRTGDANLTQNLQSGLSDLVHRLERRGFEAEVWAPHSSNVNSSQNIRSSNDGSAFQNGGRDPRDAQHGNGGQQSNSRNRPRWVAELEQKLATGDVE